MGLQRWHMGSGTPSDDTGNAYWAADVDALLARIRAAVAAERRAGHQLMEVMDDWYCERPQSEPPFSQAKDLDAKGAALDALLTAEAPHA